MPLRLGIDLDGTLADLASAYHQIEHALPDASRPGSDADAADIEAGEAEQAAQPVDALAASRRQSRRRDRIWQIIRDTDDFWLGLAPIEPGVIARLHTAAVGRRWEVVFLTQRPSTAGQTVQRQTQQWLVREGFELPSVVTLTGSRGQAAVALELDVLVDDHRQNCVDVLADTRGRCRAFLLQRQPAEGAAAVAADLGFTVVGSVAEALDQIEMPSAPPRLNPFQRLRGRLGL